MNDDIKVIALFFVRYYIQMYIRHLPCKHSFLIDKNQIPPNHALYNPSADGPFLYIRANEHSAVDEKNYVILFDETQKTMRRIDSPMHTLQPSANLFKGIEDLRIVVFEGHVWFSGTTTHASYKMTNELIVGYFDKGLSSVEKMSVVDIGSLPVKNVCPFVMDGKLKLIDTYLGKIYEVSVEEDSGEIVATCKKTISYASGISSKQGAKWYRGSTSPVHLHGNTWGLVVHDIIFNDDAKLVTRLSYFHYWVEMDMSRGVITFVSSPFWCLHWGIEYISGIRYNKTTNVVELFLGVQDSLPVRITTTLQDLRIGK